MDVPDKKIYFENSQPILIEDTGNNNQKLLQISPVYVTILGKNDVLNNNIADVINVTIYPDEFDKNYEPITKIDNTTYHLLNDIHIASNFGYDIKNMVVTINVPDGMLITNFNASNLSEYTCQITLDDGSTTTDTFVPYGRSIKNIKLTFPDFPAYTSMNPLQLRGVLAKKYTNGSEVKVGDTLLTTLTITADNLIGTANASCLQTIVGKSNDEILHENSFNTDSTQKSKDPGQKNAGYIKVINYDLIDNPAQLTYYVVLPTDATVDLNTGITGLPGNAKISELSVNNRTILKIDGYFPAGTGYGGGKERNHWNIQLDNQNIINQLIDKSDYSVYVVLPDGQELSDGKQSQVSDADKIYVENLNNAYRLFNGTWEIITSLGTYSTSQAQGNNNASLTTSASSDSNGSKDMAFSTVIVNSQDKNLNNAEVITNVPSIDDGKSEYNIYLKDKDSVSVINNTTSSVISSGITQYYSMDKIDLANAAHDPELMSHFVTADQITDWSKVKSVLTKINQIPHSSIYSIVFKGQDPNIVKDINKTAYTSSILWTDTLKPFIINPADKNSASIKITGKSTVHFKLHFEDNSQPDISIPALSHIYQDGIDTMQLSDFIKATKNSDYDEAVKNQDYSKISKAIIDAIPSDYVLRVENGAHIENSNSSDPNNLPAEFDKTVQYYFDGDTVVFDLVKKEDFEGQTVVINRDIHFVNIENNNKLKDDIKQSTTPVTIKGKRNPLTGAAGVTNIDEVLKSQTLDKYTDFPKIDGYLQVSELNNGIIPAIPSGLINDYVSNNVDSKGKCYDIDIANKITPNTKLSPKANTTAFNQDVTVYYIPSEANLISVGQNLGKDNQLLGSSSSINQDGSVNEEINFAKSDADLVKPGYTYKVYYAQDTSLADSSVTGSFYPHNKIEGNNIFHYILASEIIQNSSLEKYNSLQQALQAHPQYDKKVDASDSNYLGIAGYTQNFFVVYTPIEDSDQNLYILSDNDPYKNNDLTKPYALPDSIEQSESMENHFKLTGKSGDSLLNNSYDFPSFTSYNWPDDPNRPYILSNLSPYKRVGYYIQKATYQVKDNTGKPHVVTITNNLDIDNFKKNGSYSDTGTDSMLQLLNTLTTSGMYEPIQIKDSNKNPNYEISINGLSNLELDDSGRLIVPIPDDKKWVFDDTVYGDAKTDPAPQIITIHYAPLPLVDQNSSIRIHYVDVDNIPPLTDTDYQQISDNYNVTLDKDYKYSAYYSLSNGQNIPEFLLNSDHTLTTTPLKTYDQPQATITIPITDGGESYDNTNEDEQILKLLDNKFIVVQRDKQTLGKQIFDPYASDDANGTFNYNQPGPEIMGGYMSSIVQNYYVYLKRAQTINYQVLVEDENGNVEKTLVKPIQLGTGANGDNIASTTIKHEDGTTETIGAKFADLLKGTDDIFKDYDIVAPDSTNTKIKKSDSLDKDWNFTDPDKEQPKLLTIYVTHKKGSVHIHYIDVSGKQPDKAGNYKPEDVKEIAGTEQDIKDKNYGDPYTNKLWNYSSHGYKLATKDIPAGATSGTISEADHNVYVYLTKVSDGGGNIPPVENPNEPVETPKPPVEKPHEPIKTPEPPKENPKTPETPSKTPSTPQKHTETHNVNKVKNNNSKINSNFSNTNHNKTNSIYAEKTLPKTGERSNNLGLLGILLASGVMLFSLFIDRKHKDNN